LIGEKIDGVIGPSDYKNQKDLLKEKLQESEATVQNLKRQQEHLQELYKLLKERPVTESEIVKELKNSFPEGVSLRDKLSNSES